MYGQIDMRLGKGVPKEAQKPTRFAKCPAFHGKTLFEQIYSYGYWIKL
jgi:hypothetical protein